MRLLSLPVLFMKFTRHPLVYLPGSRREQIMNLFLAPTSWEYNSDGSSVSVLCKAFEQTC